ncbi:MAG: PA14 domain-containing protein, partial [Planctomycetota bacterium]
MLPSSVTLRKTSFEVPEGLQGGNDPHGPLGAKMAVFLEEADAEGDLQPESWVFYRRVTGGDPELEGKIRAVINGDAAARIAALYADAADPVGATLGHMMGLSNAQFDALATAVYGYDTEGRVNSYTKGVCCGSDPSTTTYVYSSQSGAELDRWQQKRVTNERVSSNGPGRVHTRYLNPNGTILLSIEEWHDGSGGVTRSVTRREVDAAGRVVKTYQPESINLTGTYAENLDGTIGTIPLHASDGEIYTRVYNASSSDGLRGEYFKNDSFSGPPSISRVDTEMYFDWEFADPWVMANADLDDVEFTTFPDYDDVTEVFEYPYPDTTFSARWSGTFRVSESGSYTFHAVTYDGIKVEIDLDQNSQFDSNEVLIDRAADPNDVVADSAAVSLTAGDELPIKIEFVHDATVTPEDRVEVGFELLWTEPGETSPSPLGFDVLFSGEGSGGALLSELVQQGENGTPALVKSYEYYGPHAWSPNYLPGTHLNNRVKTKTRYAGDPGALVAETTTTEYYDEHGDPAGYLFHDDVIDPAAGGSGYYPKYVVTRRSLGGGGDELVTRETRDDEGRTVFRQGPDGVIHYYQYLDTSDLDDGRMVYHIADYDPATFSIPSGLPGPGLSIPALPNSTAAGAEPIVATSIPGQGPHENRLTAYTISSVSGETLAMSEYKGTTLLTKTAYLTTHRSNTAMEFPGYEERRVYSEIYYDAGDLEWKVARPVQVTISEPGGNTVSSSTAELLSWA